MVQKTPSKNSRIKEEWEIAFPTNFFIEKSIEKSSNEESNCHSTPIFQPPEPDEPSIINNDNVNTTFQPLSFTKDSKTLDTPTFSKNPDDTMQGQKLTSQSNYFEKFGYLYYDNYPHAKPNQRVFITDLHSDILSHILSYLIFYDRLSLKNTCHYFKSIYDDVNTKCLFFFREEERILNSFMNASTESQKEIYESNLAAQILNNQTSDSIDWKAMWEVVITHSMKNSIRSIIQREKKDGVLSKAYEIPKTQIKQFLTQQIAQIPSGAVFTLLKDEDFARPDIKCFSDLLQSKKSDDTLVLVKELLTYDFVKENLDISLPLLLSKGYTSIAIGLVESEYDYSNIPDVDQLWKKVFFLAIERNCPEFIDILVKKRGVVITDEHVKYAFKMQNYDLFVKLMKRIEISKVQINVWFANSLSNDNWQFFNLLLNEYNPGFDEALKTCIHKGFTDKLKKLLLLSTPPHLKKPSDQELRKGMNNLEQIEWPTINGVTKEGFQHLIYLANKNQNKTMVSLLLKDVRSYYCIDNKFLESMLKTNSLIFCECITEEVPCRVDFTFEDSILFHRVATYPVAVNFLLGVPDLNPRSYNDMGLFRILHYMVESSLVLLLDDERFKDVRWRINDALMVLNSGKGLESTD
mmetsp:Transcript_10019/g.14749  ORF Transcript_10019/g.14749 Transcript_10019/m.14749 type:complete len:635 (+) Transcript_10019:52-1956(+)